ncbi:hypothetical protein FPSE_03923 [Fusarium pseudograminearum CS3096]|uniref:Uncharacterized protein n=1 Tax=Fusarium pseudograminearum (strain CS3096) TaxID=1028729 RepID=K3VPL7_FUSPC|nr:hypothetical protein FPSE_03923 [Fusarium pseudograminearum CS3096]EKJ75743.1 hypothetical protein FPSE_03923 [Fusarium pseudograminearum CS3096]
MESNIANHTLAEAQAKATEAQDKANKAQDKANKAQRDLEMVPRGVSGTASSVDEFAGIVRQYMEDTGVTAVKYRVNPVYRSE